MVLKDFIFQNLYYFVSVVALLSGLLTYLYFYNREALSYSGDIVEIENSDSTTSISSPKAGHIVVDLSGAIERPGIYSLDVGDRLADLISLSGGVTNEVSEKWLSKSLNLSSLLQDQQKIYIPFEWEISPQAPAYAIRELMVSEPLGSSVMDSTVDATDVGAGTSEGDSEPSEVAIEDIGGLVNVNQASEKALIELPGVGEVTAGKIIDNRPYIDIQELEEKTGIYASTIDKIKSLIIF